MSNAQQSIQLVELDYDEVMATVKRMALGLEGNESMDVIAGAGLVIAYIAIGANGRIEQLPDPDTLIKIVQSTSEYMSMLAMPTDTVPQA